MSPQALAIIVGAGPGLGAACARAFAAKGCAVAVLARNADSLKTIADGINAAGGIAKPFTCDVTQSASVASAFKDIQSAFPGAQLKVAIFNANSPFVMKPFLNLSESDLRGGLEVNTVGAFHFAQASLPLLLEHKTGGTLIFTGATASTKGSAKFAAFAAPKFALRAMAQSLAREFHPQGIHIAHTLIDGIIDTDRVKGMMGETKPDTRMSPDEMAKSYVFLTEQEKSSWTHELDLRPFAETF